MKRRTLGENVRGSFSMSAGWLFADLLLVLAMLFLAANTMGIHPPPPTPKSTPTPTMTPTPKILAQLEQNPIPEFTIEVDTRTLVNNNPGAANLVKQEIIKHVPQGRSAGFIIVYGTDPTNCSRANQVSDKVYDLVRELSKTNSAFTNISMYHHLCNVDSDANAIKVDIFLFAQSPSH